MKKPSFIAGSENQSERLPLLSFFKSILTSLIVCLVLIIVLSILITYTNIPENTIGISVDVISVFGVFLTGFLSARYVSGKGWLYGLISGIFFMIMLFIIGFLIFDGVPFRGFNIFLVIMCLLAGILGGMLGIGTKLGKNNLKKPFLYDIMCEDICRRRKNNEAY